MCGRYSLVLRPPTLRRRLREYGLPVAGPDTNPSSNHAHDRHSGRRKDSEHASNHNRTVNDEKALEELDPSNEEEASEGTRQSYNIAPGYIEPVYRAIVARDDEDPGPGYQGEDQGNKISPRDNQVTYILQGMKWGLVPSWTKHNPDYRSTMRPINCRDDSLLHNSLMWNSMKKKKRCAILAEGFYEWQKKGKEKIPHYIKQKDGSLMYMAGLWDCVTLPDPDTGQPMRSYTYTIITVSASSQMEFLHNRMPALLTTPKEILTWLDPTTTTWTPELQSLLRSFPGTLEIYPVPKEVGRVGNNDKSFVLPRDSEGNRSNIKHWFGKKLTKRVAVITTEGIEINVDRDEHMNQLEPEDGSEERPEKDSKQETEESQLEGDALLLDTEKFSEPQKGSPTPMLSVSRKRVLAKGLSEVQEGPHLKEQRRATHSMEMVESGSKPQRRPKSSTSNNRPTGKGVRNQPSKKVGNMTITNFFST